MTGDRGPGRAALSGIHERVTVTKNGSPVAVILAVEDYESLVETLEVLSDPRAGADIRQAEAEMSDPHRVGKPLRFDVAGYWSARRGQYRVIYSIHDDEVLVKVVRISHRAEAYAGRPTEVSDATALSSTGRWRSYTHGSFCWRPATLSADCCSWPSEQDGRELRHDRSAVTG